MDNYKKFTKNEALIYLSTEFNSSSEWQDACNYAILRRIILTGKEVYSKEDIIAFIQESNEAL